MPAVQKENRQIKQKRINKVQERICKILESLNEGIHEREETIAVALLAALAGQNIFLLGPPGTAKSLISRRLSHAFETKAYFEYLMQKFSTPEEVFGPISISELKKDNYTRKTKGFLPTSDFAFLDEIWKSGPAILNTLLTIINEKIFRNGQKIEQVPLQVLISASNETPPENQGLEALYDRFLVRLHVPPIGNREHFESLLATAPTNQRIGLPSELVVKREEWECWQSEMKKVKLSADTLHIIHDIRVTLDKEKKKLNLYISDRRWQRAAMLLKAAAYFCGREETSLVDTLLLRHCLWTTDEDREIIINIVEDSVRKNGFKLGNNLAVIDQEKDNLEQEIKEEIYHTEDVYKTVEISGKEFFKCIKEDSHSYSSSRITMYIPKDSMKTKGDLHPVDKHGSTIDDIIYNFNGQGTCEIKRRYTSNAFKNNVFTPEILFRKGARKEVNSRLIEAFSKEIKSLSNKIKEMSSKALTGARRLSVALDTPFLSKKSQAIALEGVEKQIQDMHVMYEDCKRLEKMI